MGNTEPKKKQDHTWTYEDDKTRIVINRKWCKGCQICVEFCPKNTLAMEGDKVVVADIESCSRCMMCEIRCPDFGIEVTDLRPKVEKPLPAAPCGPVPTDIEGPILGDLNGNNDKIHAR